MHLQSVESAFAHYSFALVFWRFGSKKMPVFSEKSLIRPSRSQGFHDLPELARSNTNLVLERSRLFGFGLNDLDCQASLCPQSTRTLCTFLCVGRRHIR
jgi:hypothetical protein